MDQVVHIENISELFMAMGQGEPDHPLIGIIDFSTSHVSAYANVKISTGFYTVMQKNLCPGAMRYGRNYYDFQEGSLFFGSPNQVVEMEDPDENQDVYGWGLFFHPELIRGTSLGGRMKDYSYFSYSVFEALHASEKEKQKLSEIVDDIQAELKQNIDRHSKTVIVSMLELLLNYCNRYYDRQFITRAESNKDLISEFESLLQAYFESEALQTLGFPSVKYFAEQLHLSPNYLGDLLKKETGKNGTEHIQLHVIDLARDRLLGSTASVSEIAYQLGFEYPQYFSKLFKKNTGMTPAEYRNLN